MHYVHQATNDNKTSTSMPYILNSLFLDFQTILAKSVETNAIFHKIKEIERLYPPSPPDSMLNVHVLSSQGTREIIFSTLNLGGGGKPCNRGYIASHMEIYNLSQHFWQGLSENIK